MAQWFLFEAAASDSGGPFAELPQNVLDRHGEPMDSYEPYDGPNQVRRGVHVRDAGDAYLRVSPRRRVGDVLCYAYHGCLACSQQMMTAVDTAGLAIDPDLYRWPLHLTDMKGRPLRDYLFLWPLKRWPVLDMLQAEVEYSANPEILRKVVRWVLDETALPPFDLIATSHSFQWLASDRFKRTVESNGVTGAAFRAI
jgi:hypothetical protein